MRESVVLDSSIWIEIFSKGPLFKSCTKVLNQSQVVGVPALSVYEIYRKIAKNVDQESALSAVAYLRQFGFISLSAEVALLAGDIAIEKKLAMADAFMLAHCEILHASLVTLDNDFANIPNVKVIRR